MITLDRPSQNRREHSFWISQFLRTSGKGRDWDSMKPPLLCNLPVMTEQWKIHRSLQTGLTHFLMDISKSKREGMVLILSMLVTHLTLSQIKPWHLHCGLRTCCFSATSVGTVNQCRVRHAHCAPFKYCHLFQAKNKNTGSISFCDKLRVFSCCAVLFPCIICSQLKIADMDTFLNYSSDWNRLSGSFFFKKFF